MYATLSPLSIHKTDSEQKRLLGCQSDESLWASLVSSSRLACSAISLCTDLLASLLSYTWKSRVSLPWCFRPAWVPLSSGTSCVVASADSALLLRPQVLSSSLLEFGTVTRSDLRRLLQKVALSCFQASALLFLCDITLASRHSERWH